MLTMKLGVTSNRNIQALSKHIKNKFKKNSKNKFSNYKPTSNMHI